MLGQGHVAVLQRGVRDAAQEVADEVEPAPRLVPSLFTTFQGARAVSVARNMTRSVIHLIVPPLPDGSRPSTTMQTNRQIVAGEVAGAGSAS